MEKDMELTELYPELVFNLKKVVVVRGKNRVKGRLHRVTACEVAYQCSEQGTSIVFGAVSDMLGCGRRGQSLTLNLFVAKNVKDVM